MDTEITPDHPLEKYFEKITKYHYLVFALVFLSKMPLTWHVMSLIFLSPPMRFDCGKAALTEDKLSTGPCPCNEPIWNRSVFSETVQTKFDLCCDTDWMTSFSQSMFYAGLLVGGLIFGFLSDKIGRLTSYCISCGTVAIFGIAVSVMPSAPAFIAMRFLEGVGCGGVIVTSYVFCIEYCGRQHREAVTALFHIPILLGHSAMAGISYGLRHCDSFQLAISVPMLVFVPFYWILLESPKWLCDTRKVDQVVSVMEKICDFNNTSCDNIREEIAAYHTATEAADKKKIRIWTIFKHRKLSINFACMGVLYFVCGNGFYGVSQYIGKMHGDIHLNVAVSGFLLLPSTVASLFLLKAFARRPLLMVSNFFSGTFMFIVIFIPSKVILGRVIAACICNSFFFLSFIVVFLYSVELFPTAIRNSVIGVLSIVSRTGQMVAPIINSLSETWAGIFFAVIAIIGGLVCFPLPETKNIVLPSSLEETKTLTKKKMKLSKEGENVDESLGTSSKNA